ncbi:hypothetical protein ACJMK2_014034 [Sinanodonta woodiana]|uniref:Endonuclease/exonuclease/phosphatase domain-containing protein n=1 Tax=Sinanodonta woodiana TaxID=1069815 RepID=A0ABD3V2N7_SINWO
MNAILSGDFNLPTIDWNTNTVKDNPQYESIMNTKLAEITTNNDLQQMVTEATRGNNILDLIFTTNPALVHNIEIHPGMSDHGVIIADINLKAKISKKKQREVHLFKKADWDNLKTDVEQELTKVLKDQGKVETSTTEDIWLFLKKPIMNAVNKHIPQNMIGGKQHLPLINTHIKRIIRQRQRRYNAYKK